MLVLSRRLGQAIVVNGNVEIRVLGQNTDGSIRIGIIAPPNVTVHREEVQMRINAEKAENK